MTVTVVHKNPICSFNADWIKHTVDQYLKFEPWVPEKTYEPGTLFYMNFLDFNDPGQKDFCQQLAQQGFRVFIDNIWEVNPGPVPGAMTLCCDAWFWYNESLHYQYLGYDQYQPRPSPEYLALMPMRLEKPHRTELLEVMPVSITDRMIWSYVAQGRQLPGDRDIQDVDTQRYMNPEWYNKTYLSMVVETNVRPGSKYTPIFITEKTFKPIAFQHPFVVYGNRGTLRRLRQWGFETWDHLWDESYDEIVDPNERRSAVIELLNTIQIQPYSTETLRRLQHNRNLFFDTELVKQRIVEEILMPIINYANSQ